MSSRALSRKRQTSASSSASVKTEAGEKLSPPSQKRSKVASEASVAPIHIARLSKEHKEWPVRPRDLTNARTFIRRAATSDQRILLVPDKDADGLSAGCIVKRALFRVGAKAENIAVHHIPTGKAPKGDQDLQSYEARWILVLDQGSVAGPALVPGAEKGWDCDEEDAVRCMVLDHHHVTDLDADCPQGALLVNASHHTPVSTSALLAWCVCRPFWPDSQEGGKEIDYLALIGTCGDLSVNVAWQPPWPDFEAELKRWGKSRIGKVVAMINAPRRTPEHDAHASWTALDASESPLDVLDADRNPSFARLNEARRLVAVETEKQTHTPPKFSKDSRVALLTIHTAYQVHPSIATRWSGTLKGAKRLEVVMCANTGFGAFCEEKDGDATTNDAPDELNKERFIHFSCRRANAARERGEDPNIIELLHDYARRDPTFLSDLEASGHGGSFARGHREASGGILPPRFWKRFVELMQIGVKPTPPPDGGSKAKSPKKMMPQQSNKLTNYFGAKQQC